MGEPNLTELLPEPPGVLQPGQWPGPAHPRDCLSGTDALWPPVTSDGSAPLSRSSQPINFMNPICSSCSSLYNPHLFQMSRECAPEILNIPLY